MLKSNAKICSILRKLCVIILKHIWADYIKSMPLQKIVCLSEISKEVMCHLGTELGKGNNVWKVLI